jgi:hypothetical protein
LSSQAAYLVADELGFTLNFLGADKPEKPATTGGPCGAVGSLLYLYYYYNYSY